MVPELMLDGESLTLEDVITVAYAPSRGEPVEVALSEAAWEKVRRAQRAVAQFIARGEIVYGVTTGFGAFKDRIIPPDQVQQLQNSRTGCFPSQPAGRRKVTQEFNRVEMRVDTEVLRQVTQNYSD